MTDAIIITVLFYCLFIFCGGLVLGALIYRISLRQVPALSCLAAGAAFLLPFNLLILYYVLWLIPHHTPAVYLGVLIIVNAILYLTTGLTIRQFLFQVGTEIKLLMNEYAIIFLPLFMIVLVFAGVLISTSRPFVEHDAMEYAVFGNSIANSSEIVYSKHHYDAQTGFYYSGLHGYSLPLLKTFECFLNNWLPSGDFIFRSLNAISGFLLVFISGLAGLHFSRRFAGWMMGCLLMSYVFIFSFFQVSLDHFRMIQLFAFLLLWYQSRKYIHTNYWYLLLCFLAGMSSFAHALNMLLISAFLVFECYFLFRLKFRTILFCMIGFFSGGALHYFFETFLGTGWIFQ